VIVMATEHDPADWFYPEPLPEEIRADLLAIHEHRRRRSSSMKHVAAVREGEKAHLKERAKVVDQLQAERKRQRAERARTRGLSTAEILAARVRG
jgi:hypothetical protein